MFLDHVSVLGLLKHDENSNILANYPINIRKNIIRDVASALLDPSTSKSILITNEHLKWAMEAVGQAFNLVPVDDDVSVQIVEKAIELYRRWMLEPEHKPKPLQEDTSQIFFQNILKHFSLLFSVPIKKDDFSRQSKLCSKILNIFLNVGRELQSTLSTETWEVWLKLLLGMTDSLLGNPSSQECELSKDLAPQVLRILTELWLMSHTLNPTMWSTLKGLMKNWRNLFATVRQWNATTLGLTRHINFLLYGPTEGTNNVVIKLDDSSTLTLTPEFTFYAWNHFLTALGNINELPTSREFKEACHGISALINTYLNVGTNENSPKNVYSPDGNTILHIFGEWIFEAIKLENKASFEEGTCILFDALASIFYQKRNCKFEPIYSASFYSCLCDALQREGRILSTCLNATKSFFTLELEGFRSLVPFYCFGVTNYLLKAKQETDKVTRLSCIEILSCLISLPNLFGKTTLAIKLPKEIEAKQESLLLDSSKAKPLPELTTYSAVKLHITQLLIKILRTEDNPTNLQALLWCIVLHHYEVLDEGTEFEHNVIDIILTKFSSNPWAPKVMLSALRTLCAFSQGYHKLPHNNEEANAIAIGLSKFVSLLTNAADISTENVRIINEIFRCIGDWTMVDQWILKFPSTFAVIIRAITNVLTFARKQLDEKRQEFLTSSAQTLLFHLLNKLGYFPSASGTRSVSSLVNEGDILASIKKNNPSITNTDQFIRYFMIKDSILFAVIDVPHFEGGPGTTIVVRDITGKYTWNSHLKWIPNSQKLVSLPPSQVPKVMTPHNYQQSGKKVNESDFNELFTFLKEKSDPSINTICALSQKQEQSEENYLKQTKYGMDISSSIQAPVTKPLDFYLGESKIPMGRTLLNSIGFTSGESQGKLVSINQNSDFFTMLRFLDTSSERFCQQIGVVYVASGQKSEKEIYSNQGGSIDYQEFLSGLGWGVSLAEHNGYIGDLDQNGMAPYYSNYETEVIFACSTLLPNEVDKAKKVGSSKVIIVWLEDEINAFDVSIFKASQIQILIHPLPSVLYHVRLIVQSSDIAENVGPLYNNVLVRKELLSLLVRMTAMDGFYLASSNEEHPLSNRRKWLKQIYQIFHKEPDIYYEEFFASKVESSNSSQGSFDTTNPALKKWAAPNSAFSRSAPKTQLLRKV